MHYSILIYDSEATVDALSKEEMAGRIDKHRALQEDMSGKGKLGPVARLAPTTSAVSLRKKGGETLVLDGPFTETKEQFVGFYVVACGSLEEAIEAARMLPLDSGTLEIRPIAWLRPEDG